MSPRCRRCALSGSTVQFINISSVAEIYSSAGNGEIKENPAWPGFANRKIHGLTVSEQGADSCSLRALWAILDFELHVLTFLEAFVAIHLDCGKVCKYVIATAAGGDEAVAFSGVTPLHGTCCHAYVPRL